jgi:glycosyltransferase involved in cell wall biosynthesis
MEDLMWKYVLWYYAQLDWIYVPSRSTGKELARKGLRPECLRLFPRGIDIQRFHPSHRDPDFMEAYAERSSLKLLYVGRVSKEKNLPLLVEVFKALCRDMKNLSLIVVGDGPYLETMKEELKETPCAFTGYLKGEPLEKIYASSDLFVFPSTTDTFGNVVLEAQASGIPVVVTDKGGPQENIIPGKTGLVVPADDGAAMLEAVRSLIKEPFRLTVMGKAARTYMEGRSFEKAFNETWNMYDQEDKGIKDGQVPASAIHQKVPSFGLAANSDLISSFPHT